MVCKSMVSKVSPWCVLSNQLQSKESFKNVNGIWSILILLCFCLWNNFILFSLHLIWSRYDLSASSRKTNPCNYLD